MTEKGYPLSTFLVFRAYQKKGYPLTTNNIAKLYLFVNDYKKRLEAVRRLMNTFTVDGLTRALTRQP